jgi:hypothetical protein
LKRAFKELLEACSQKLGGDITYESMYDLDGNLLTTMEDISPECKLLLVSREKAPETPGELSMFRGLIDKKEV